jgi:hypothetical protein
MYNIFGTGDKGDDGGINEVPTIVVAILDWLSIFMNQPTLHDIVISILSPI